MEIYRFSIAGHIARQKLILAAFTKALCLEMQKRPVRVNALLPGWVDSPMWNSMSESPFHVRRQSKIRLSCSVLFRLMSPCAENTLVHGS